MTQNRRFGEQLRYWRHARGRTQLDLSITAGYSQRHLSFLESGRSQPSRETVIALADCLEVPVSDRNELLQAAGFAPVYSAEPIESGRLEEARRAIEEILTSHRPFPALLVDRAWNTNQYPDGRRKDTVLNAEATGWFVWNMATWDLREAVNRSAQALFRTFIRRPEAYPDDFGFNAIRLCIEDTGVKRYIDNLGPFLISVLGQLKVEVQRAVVHEELSSLVDDIQKELREIRTRTAPFPDADLPIGCLKLRRGDIELTLFTMMSAFNFPLDSTLAELRIETFFPADQGSRAYLVALDESIEATETSRTQPA